LKKKIPFLTRLVYSIIAKIKSLHVFFQKKQKSPRKNKKPPKKKSNTPSQKNTKKSQKRKKIHLNLGEFVLFGGGFLFYLENVFGCLLWLK
jgi:hypothetical protein